MVKSTTMIALSVIIALGTVVVSAGVVIDFDDVAAHQSNSIDDVIREQYAHLGVHFNTDGRHSGIVRVGVSQGDPGNWDLEGTSGPQFLGHNSSGRTGSIEFDMPISGFQVDAAEGHAGVIDLTFEAYDATGLLEAVTLERTAQEVWETITLQASGITRIEYHSQNDFGLDNIRFVPEPATVALLGMGTLMARRWRKRR